MGQFLLVVSLVEQDPNFPLTRFDKSKPIQEQAHAHDLAGFRNAPPKCQSGRVLRPQHIQREVRRSMIVVVDVDDDSEKLANARQIQPPFFICRKVGILSKTCQLTDGN